jgi:hypothetical protein
MLPHAVVSEHLQQQSTVGVPAHQMYAFGPALARLDRMRQVQAGIV